MPEECLTLIVGEMPPKTQIARRAKRELEFRTAVAISKKAHKLKREKKCPFAAALWEACLAEVGGDDEPSRARARDLWELASNESLRVRNHLRKTRTRRSKRTSDEADLFVVTEAGATDQVKGPDEVKEDDIPF